jgi:mannose/fructose/N-acetylgalactosamine-specific phosphotransferase system component IID
MEPNSNTKLLSGMVQKGTMPGLWSEAGLSLGFLIYKMERSNEQLGWCMSIIPALRRLRQEDDEFEATLGYKMGIRSNKKHS